MHESLNVTQDLPLLHDSDCQVEFQSFPCDPLDFLIMSSEKSIKKSDESAFVKSGTSSLKPDIATMQPPRRFKNTLSDKLFKSTVHGFSEDDRMLLRLHRQAVCREIAVSEKRRGQEGIYVSKEDVKMIYESLRVS